MNAPPPPLRALNAAAQAVADATRVLAKRKQEDGDRGGKRSQVESGSSTASHDSSDPDEMLRLHASLPFGAQRARRMFDMAPGRGDRDRERDSGASAIGASAAEPFATRMHSALREIPSVARKELVDRSLEKHLAAIRMWLSEIEAGGGDEEENLQNLGAAVDNLRRFVVVDERKQSERFFVPVSEALVKHWRELDQALRRMRRKWEKVVDARLQLARASGKWKDSLQEMGRAVETLSDDQGTIAAAYAEGHLFSSML